MTQENSSSGKKRPDSLSSVHENGPAKARTGAASSDSSSVHESGPVKARTGAASSDSSSVHESGPAKARTGAASPVSFWSRQRELTGRRSWTLALTLLLYAIFHIIETVLLLSGAMAAYTAASEKAKHIQNLHSTAVSVLGTESWNWIVTIICGLLLAMQGFSWVDSRQRLDFYESQPVSRKARFIKISLNSLFIFLMAYITTGAVGMLIMTGMGAMTGSVFASCMMQLLRSVILFVDIYALSVLAVMLTGNIIVALFLDGAMLLYEPLMRYLIHDFCVTFFRTYVTNASYGQQADHSPTLWFAVKAGPRALLMGILLGILAMALAWLAFRKRKNEMAGRAVLYKPVRIILKIAVSFAVAMIAIPAVYSVTPSTPVCCVIAALAALITGCIMEVIYTFDFRRLTMHPAGSVAAALLAVCVFLIFRYDAFGYDSWLPRAEDTVDAFVVYDNGYITDRYLEDGSDASYNGKYEETYMHLTDIDAVDRLLEAGYNWTKANVKNESGNIVLTAPDTDISYQLVVGFRMRDGRLVTRSVYLPDTTNAAVMDDVFGTDAFREGYFPIYHDGAIRKKLDRIRIEYTDGKNISDDLPAETYYDAFKNAYEADLKQFSWSFAKSRVPVGKVSLIFGSSADTSSSSVNCPVYAEFTHTIAFLKENGIYLEPLDDLDVDTAWSLAGPFSETELDKEMQKLGTE
ncbi:MAG: hypothetical protein ACI4DT_11785 [Chordicoccus sp.]